MKIKKETCNNRDIINKAKKNNTIVSGNVGDCFTREIAKKKFISLIEFFK